MILRGQKMKWLGVVFCLFLSNLCHGVETVKPVTSFETDEKTTNLVFSTFNAYTLSQVVSAILTRAYANLEIDIAVRYLPGKRALVTSNSGQVDGELFRISGMSQHFENLIAVPAPILELHTTVYSRDYQFKVQGWDSLRSYHIGFLRGFKKAEQSTSGMNVYQDDSLEKLFKLLAKGRIDLVVESSLGAGVILKRTFLAKIKALYPPVDNFHIYHYLHKKNRHLLKPLTEVLRAMQKNGEIDTIIEQNITRLATDNS